MHPLADATPGRIKVLPLHGTKSPRFSLTTAIASIPSSQADRAWIGGVNDQFGAAMAAIQEMPPHQEQWLQTYIATGIRELMASPGEKAHFKAELEVIRPTLDALGMDQHKPPKPIETKE